MKVFFFYSVLWIVWIFCIHACVFPEKQYLALYDLYLSTKGRHWSWQQPYSTNGIPWEFYNLTSNPCIDNWQGITCVTDQTNCLFTELTLNGLNLVGTLPDSFGELIDLKILTINGNIDLIGGLPYSIGNLTALEQMNVYYNGLIDQLPDSIGQLINLQIITLSTNKLRGSLPFSIGQLTQLSTLDVDGNAFTGIIPSSIGQLHYLQFCEFQNNNFSGSIPETIGFLTNITRLDFSYNNLTGTIPPSIGNMSGLSYLFLMDNHLTGSIPDTIGQLTQLRFFEGDHNHLNGSIPDSIGNCTQLLYFYLDDNHISGTLPDSMHQLTQLSDFSVMDNYLTGTLPESWGNTMLSLAFFNLFGNLLTGTLPSSYGSLIKLYIFFVCDNLLTGTMPSSYGQLNQLVDFYTHDNMLTGTIPSSFSNFSRINNFQCFNNYFTGTLPSSLGALTKLVTFALNYNAITGTFPDSYANWEVGISSISMDLNYLTGTIPNYIPNFQILFSLTLDQNYLTGTIPNLLGNLNLLAVLILYNNYLTGSIPTSFANLPEIFELDLSDNYLTGSIPDPFTRSPMLLDVSLSDNCFIGTLPQSFCQNKYLLGLYLNGLHASCSEYILPSFISKTYSLTHAFYGSIPTCYYTMSNLKALQLAGNGFTGSLPSNIHIGPQLINLTLSHNILTGSLPLIFQEKGNWTSLDLSFNRLSGSLTQMMLKNKSSSIISLKQNHFSGQLSSDLIHSKHIDILRGNLFSCQDNFNPKKRNDELPVSDPFSSYYSCGSNKTNVVLYFWAALHGLVLVSLFLGYFFYYRVDPSKSPSASFSSSSLTIDISNPIVTKEIQNNNKEKDQEKIQEDKENFPEHQHTGEENPIQTNNISSLDTSNPIKPSKPPKSSSLYVKWWSESINILYDWYQACYTLQHNQYDSQEIPRESLVSLSNIGILPTSSFSMTKQELESTPVLSERNNKPVDLFPSADSSHPNQSYPHIQQLLTLFSNIRQYCGLLLVIILGCFFPLYIYFSDEYGTYSDQYVWTCSMAYLSGEIPGIVFFVFFVLLAYVMIVHASYFFVKQSDSNNKEEVGENESILSSKHTSFDTQITQNNNNSPSTSHPAEQPIEQPADPPLAQENFLPTQSDRSNHWFFSEERFSSWVEIFNTSWILRIFLIVGLIVINIAITLAVNILYVYYFSSSISTHVSMILTLCLSLYKVIWTQIVILNWYQELLIKCSLVNVHTRTTLLFYLTLFTNVLAPLIALSIANTDCFYYLFNQSEPITYFRYNVFLLYAYSEATRMIYSIESTFQPPFLYSYQCSSALLNNYVDVILFRYLISGFLVPFMKLSLLLYEYSQTLDSTQPQDTTKSSTTNSIWTHLSWFSEQFTQAMDYFPSSAPLQFRESEMQTIKKSKKQTNKSNVEEPIDNISIDKEPNDNEFVDEELGHTDANLSKESLDTSMNSQNHNVLDNPSYYDPENTEKTPITFKPWIMFAKMRFAILFLGDIAMCLTFGLLFPPIALIIIYSMMLEQLIAIFAIGKMLRCQQLFRSSASISSINKSIYQQTCYYLESVNQECIGLRALLIELYPIMGLFVTLVWSIFLIDILGNQYFSINDLIVFFVLTWLLPVILPLFDRLCVTIKSFLFRLTI